MTESGREQFEKWVESQDEAWGNTFRSSEGWMWEAWQAAFEAGRGQGVEDSVQFVSDKYSFGIAIAFYCARSRVGRASVQTSKRLNVAERLSKKRLTEAINWAEKNHPLPRCKHGNALRDGAGEKLEPSCGCRLLFLDPDFRRDAPKSGPYCARCQRPVVPKKSIRVTVDWSTWMLTEGGEEFVGPDCWEKILADAGDKPLATKEGRNG